MRILVTGGAGFIGSALIRYLIETTGVEIVNVDALTYAGNETSLALVSRSPCYIFVRASITDAEALEDILITYHPSAIINLAAESHVDRSIDGSRAFIETNVLGTYTLLEAARNYWNNIAAEEAEAFRFVHVSTDEVYGSLGPEGLFTEESPYDPSSPYAASKAASDHLVSAWYRTYGLPVIISNCSNNYGSFQLPEKLIPHIILNALEEKSLPIYGDGTNIRDWLYVEDHVKALDLILRKGVPGETYNIGGRNEATNLFVVSGICTILDSLRPRSRGRSYSELIEYVTDRPGHDKRYAIDASKLEKELGWKAEETFTTGLVKTVKWYLKNEWWWEPIRRKVYSGERLGLRV